MRKNKCTSKIKDIANVASGVTLRKGNEEYENSFALIKLADLDDHYRLNRGNLTHTRKVKPKERHLLDAGDIIFGSKGEYNFATVIPPDLGPAIAASSFFVMKNFRSDVLPEYLAWYVNSKKGQDYLSQIRKRTSIPYIAKSKFVEMPIPIIPIDVQELIVKIDNLTKREQKLQQLLMKQRKKLIEAMLVDHINKKHEEATKTTPVLSNFNNNPNTTMSKQKSNIEIAPDGSDWKVKRQGAQRASKKFNKKSNAFDYGRDLARKEKGELFIKNRDGKISDRRSYGNDPFPPRDKR